MTQKGIAQGTVHTVPADLKKALTAASKSLALWNDTITPLGRNEWICWTTSVKKAETRADHVERVVRQIQEGKRRPCCWAGCPHR